MSATEWLTEIGKAADDLGYGIVSLELGRIALVRNGHASIVIETALLTGSLLRELLVSQKVEQPEPTP